ncbi:MAG: ACP phosphodiesterase [Planctomycetota bacterium]
MNYLAHLVIAERVEASSGFLLGSLLPDFVRGRIDGVPGAVARGAAMHRWVDRVTDSDPDAGRTRERLRERHGRFSGILADVLFDHCLARRFTQWQGEEVDAAIDRYHIAIHASLDDAPPGARPGLSRLVEAGWMRHYAELDGIRWVLGLMEQRLSMRFKRSVHLSHAADTFAELDGAIQADFDVFFDRLRRRVDAEVDVFRTETQSIRSEAAA